MIVESYEKALTKDPDAVLDYGFDWSIWLGTDTISSSTWTAAGLTLSSPTHDSTTTTVWAAGGAAGTSYRLTNHIVTAGGRTEDRTLKLNVADR